jgi:hypothetical protein
MENKYLNMKEYQKSEILSSSIDVSIFAGFTLI